MTPIRSIAHSATRGPGVRPWHEGGAQLLEFALTLPILLVLVIGAWDFGSAFTLKDKMTNGAREAARISVSNSLIPPSGSSAPCAQTGWTGPSCSVIAAIYALQKYMNNAGVDLSCINPNSPSGTGPDPQEYTYTCSSVSGLSIVIDRSALVTPPSGNPLPATQVTFAYPAKQVVTWFPYFPSQLQTVVTMQNLTY